MDSSVLLALIQEKGCSPSHVLELMPHLMASYLDVVIDKGTTNGSD